MSRSDVLQAVADGHPWRAIGCWLVFVAVTVKTHLLRIFAKLDVNDRTAAVVTALQRDLLPHHRDR